MEQNTLIYIPTHLYNRRKTMYKDIRIVSWPYRVDDENVFGCYVKGNFIILDRETQIENTF